MNALPIPPLPAARKAVLSTTVANKSLMVCPASNAGFASTSTAVLGTAVAPQPASNMSRDSTSTEIANLLPSRPSHSPPRHSAVTGALTSNHRRLCSTAPNLYW